MSIKIEHPIHLLYIYIIRLHDIQWRLPRLLHDPYLPLKCRPWYLKGLRGGKEG